jgi:hypothetical protein
VRRGWRHGHGHGVGVRCVLYSDFFCQEFWRVKNFGKPVACGLFLASLASALLWLRRNIHQGFVDFFPPGVCPSPNLLWLFPSGATNIFVLFGRLHTVVEHYLRGAFLIFLSKISYNTTMKLGTISFGSFAFAFC